MRLVLFDLGETLESEDRLLPGAEETLAAVAALTDRGGEPIVLGLISDFDSSERPGDVPAARKEYAEILEDLGIRSFFEPLERRTTLSVEVGVRKPDAAIFRAAIDKVAAGTPFHHVLFVSENERHVEGARRLGMAGVHFKGPGETTGEVDRLVDLPPRIRRWIAYAPCCKKRGEAVGRFASQASKSKRADPTIRALVAEVDRSRLQGTIAALTELGTRWSHGPKIHAVPEWLHGQFVARGYPAGALRYQPFDLLGGGTQRNVLCKQGPAGTGIILLCCHYDSISETPALRAPGADDDGSGVAAVLEIARILRPIALQRQILFAAFGGEEQGLYGSGECAAVAERESWPIDLVVNLDMIGYNASAGSPGRIVVEYDQGNGNPGNDAAARAYGLVMAQAAADYTALDVEHTDIWNSDYIPFEEKGYACIGAYEGEGNPDYHKSTDLLDRIDSAYLAEVARMVLATILVIARPHP